jgi:hypothetical protein
MRTRRVQLSHESGMRYVQRRKTSRQVRVEDLLKKCKSTALRKSLKTGLKKVAAPKQRSSAKAATYGGGYQVPSH